MQLTQSAGWWMGDDHSNGFEIQIAGAVRKMDAPLLYLVFHLFLYIMRSLLLDTRSFVQR